MEEIKNCPLCGSYGELISTTFGTTQRYFIKCSKCLLSTAPVDVTDKMTGTQAVHRAVELWNNRTDNSKRVKVRRVSRVKA